MPADAEKQADQKQVKHRWARRTLMIRVIRRSHVGEISFHRSPPGADSGTGRV